jgi:two-component system, chemotaxis family, CheB/CheR fusion protein
LLAISTCTLVLAALFAERRQSETALKDSSERLQLALDSAELGVWSIDAKSGRYESDARDRRIHGYPPEAPPQTVAEARSYIHPHDLPQLETAFEVSKREGSSSRSQYRLAPTSSEDVGQERWISVEGTVVRSAEGQPVRWLGVTRDITEYKKAEEGARRLVSIVESSDDAIVSLDLNGVIESWNQGAERLFGYSAEEVIGEPNSILIPPDRRDEDVAILRRIRLGELIDHFETVRLGKDGTLVDISLTVSPMRDAAGIVVGASKIARDITARKRAEEHQQFLNSELDHRVKNVIATVTAIVTQTREASSTHEDFLTGLDHRIKSLATTHELLSQGQWRGVSLSEIVRCEFAPYAMDNTRIGGPSVTLKAEAAQAVAMVLHELTTNAVKYGAFSTRSGGVLLRWWWLRNGSHARLAIEWQEIGGPLVVPPSRSGYGTCLVRELIPFELGGSVDVTFPGDGLRCRLEIPADWISPGNPSGDATQGLGAASSTPRN